MQSTANIRITQRWFYSVWQHSMRFDRYTIMSFVKQTLTDRRVGIGVKSITGMGDAPCNTETGRFYLNILTQHHCLTHPGRVTHICVTKLIIIGSDNGLWHGQRQAIIRTNVIILLIRNLVTILVKYSAKSNNFHSRKYIWRFRLRNFVEWEMSSRYIYCS